MTSPNIRLLASYDFDQWRGLFQGYDDFNQVSLSDDGVQATWSWLIDAEHVCTGLVAERQGQFVGLVHFLGKPNPLRRQIIGLLDDLFAVPDHRSGGVAVALIIGIKGAAETLGWSVVRWITRDHNYRARGLYDKLAEKTDWVLYEMTEMAVK